jgi:hypothetical protein
MTDELGRCHRRPVLHSCETGPGGMLARATLKICGTSAALNSPTDAIPIPGDGTFECGLRKTTMYVVGGGTNVQCGLIARGLGLPR